MKKSPEWYVNKAAYYQVNNNPKLSLKYFYEVLRRTKKYPQIYAKIYHQKMILCDWDGCDKYKYLADKYFKYDSPFANVARVDSPKKNLIIATNARISPRI